MPKGKNKANPPTATVRMYRRGLGDCFLLQFTKDDGGRFSVLIDCGLISVATDPKTKMGEVVADIDASCHHRIDVVIMTHEHWDHASGFSREQVQAAFDEIEIGEVWYAWTEHPENELGNRLRAERAAKIKAAKRAAHALLARNDTPLALERGRRVANLLQFFGVDDLGVDDKKIGKSLEAFWYLRNQRRDVKTRYCHPEKEPIPLDGVSGVRAFILGPPENEGLIKRGERKRDDLYAFAGDLAADENLQAAFERMSDPASASRKGGADCPFDTALCRWPGDRDNPIARPLKDLIAETWDKGDEGWRRIDNDWTMAAETLALNLDNHTNNTCLVVAFELSPGGKVLLFPADAQVGNWTSWQDTRWTVKDGQSMRVVTGPDLLQRTVFYKVGHHGSHNATLRAHGLEQMTSDELIAFVPVFKNEAEKNRWFGMPFEPLVKRLNEKTNGKVVYSDPALEKPALAGLQEGKNGLYYEYSFER